jgi:hypothetical protein
MARHDFDAVSFAFGALFASAGLILMTGVVDAGDLTDRNVWPFVVIAVGLLFLVPALGRARASEAEAADDTERVEDNGPPRVSP